jgi:hypothetical protein
MKSKQVEVRSSAEDIRAELEVLANRKAGLTPDTVLHVAKNPASCLHKYFCWDDTEAARKYRAMQAEFLIRRIRVTITPHGGKEFNVRAFVNVKDVQKDGTISYGDRGKFVPILSVMSDPDGKEQMLTVAKRELASFRSKYSILEDLANVMSEIDAVLDPILTAVQVGGAARMRGAR